MSEPVTSQTFQIWAGVWNGRGPMPPGYSNGLYYVRARIGVPAKNRWFGPVSTLNQAQVLMLDAIQNYAYSYDGKLTSAAWDIQAGKRYWQPQRKQWIIQPEDETDAVTYREGLRVNSGKTIATQTRPNKTNIGYNYAGYYPEDYAPPYFAQIGPAYFGKVYQTKPTEKPIDVGVSLPYLQLPGYQNHTITYQDLGDGILSPVNGFDTFVPYAPGMVNGNEYTFQTGGENPVQTNDFHDNNPYWIPSKNGYGDYTNAPIVITKLYNYKAPGGGISENPFFDAYIVSPDTLFPKDDFAHTIVGQGQYQDTASDGYFLSHAIIRTKAVRRMVEIVKQNIITLSMPNAIVSKPDVIAERRDLASLGVTSDVPDPDPPYIVYVDVPTLSGGTKYRVHFDTTIEGVIPEVRIPFDCYNSINIYAEKLGVLLRDIPELNTGVLPVTPDVAFPPFPIANGDTQYVIPNGDGPRYEDGTKQTNVTEVDIEISAVYLLREGGPGHETYYESLPTPFTVALIPNISGPLAVREVYNLPLWDLATTEEYPGENMVSYCLDNCTYTPAAMDCPTSSPVRAIRRETINPLQLYVGPNQSPPNPLPTIPSGLFVNETAQFTNDVAGGAIAYWVSGLDPTKYAINEAYTNSEPITRTYLNGPDPYPHRRPAISEGSSGDTNYYGYWYFVVDIDPFIMGNYAGTAKKIIAAFDAGSSLDYEALSPTNTFGWSLNVFGGVSGTPELSYGPATPQTGTGPLFAGTARLWIVKFLDKNGIPKYDNSTVGTEGNAPDYFYTGSGAYRFNLDSGEIAYFGIGIQREEVLISQNIAFNFSEARTGKALVGFDKLISTTGKIPTGPHSGITVNIDNWYGPYYATGPITVYINSDDSIQYPAPDSSLLGNDYGSVSPRQDTVINVGAVDGPEVGLLGRIRLTTDNGGDVDAGTVKTISLYSQPQKKLVTYIPQ